MVPDGTNETLCLRRLYEEPVMETLVKLDGYGENTLTDSPVWTVSCTVESVDKPEAATTGATRIRAMAIAASSARGLGPMDSPGIYVAGRSLCQTSFTP